MTRRLPALGDRIHWEGDMANAPRSGRVIELSGRAYMTIEWDEQESVGWERDGTAVEIRDKFCRGSPAKHGRRAPLAFRGRISRRSAALFRRVQGALRHEGWSTLITTGVRNVPACHSGCPLEAGTGPGISSPRPRIPGPLSQGELAWVI